MSKTKTRRQIIVAGAAAGSLTLLAKQSEARPDLPTTSVDLVAENAGPGATSQSFAKGAKAAVSKLNEIVSITEFGAVADGTDQRAKIQAAFDAVHRAGGGTVLIPQGVFVNGVAPGGYGLLLPNGVRLMGASPTGSILSFNGRYTDSCVRSAQRDDNSVSTWDTVALDHLTLRKSSLSPVALLDCTGFRSSTFYHLFLQGSGTKVADYAIRLSDRNPARTSKKSTFFNEFSSIGNIGPGFGTWMYFESTAGNCNSHTFRNLNGLCGAALFDFSDVAGFSVNTVFTEGYFVSIDRGEFFKDRVIPSDIVFSLVVGEGFHPDFPNTNTSPRGLFTTASNGPIIAQGSLIGRDFQPVGRVFAALSRSPQDGMLTYVTDSKTATIGDEVSGGGKHGVWAGYRNGKWVVIA